MFTPTPVIKNASHADPNAESLRAEDAADLSDFLGGIIRDEVARSHARPVALEGVDWSSDLPSPDPETNTAPTSPTDHNALRAAWEAEWAERAKAEREAALSAAREESYAEGFAAAQAEHEAGRQAEQAAFANDAARLRSLWEDHLAAIDPLLVELAVGVAETVLDRPLGEETHDTMTAAISSAVERLAAQPPLVVTLHPVDQLRLQEAGMTDALTATHPGLRWVPDATLAEGDWSLDAAGAAVRCVRAEVLADLRHRLGLEPAPDASE